MKKLVLTFVILLPLTTLPAFTQQRRGRQGSRIGHNLTLALARRVLNQQINEPSVDNMLLTCRACYSFDDKGENDNFMVVSTYPGMNQFLRRQGYIRIGRNVDEVFVAKAKRSKYFEAYSDGQGGFGGARFRFANFRNPRITVDRIIDPKNVPIEYDRVPTEVTMGFFNSVERVKSYASFSYESGKWSICIACRN